MRVREARVDDTAEVLAFVRAKAHFDRELGAFSGDLGTTEELIRRHLFGPRPFALLAGEPGRTVGFALYYFRYSSFRGRPSSWLDDLYVHPPARRQGAVGRLAEGAVVPWGFFTSTVSLKCVDQSVEVASVCAVASGRAAPPRCA
jgi:GNAT superfamily N-acetyltransferase